jgi:hypothetical protein
VAEEGGAWHKVAAALLAQQVVSFFALQVFHGSKA